MSGKASVHVVAFGNNRDEVLADAIEKASEFFGGSTDLVAHRDWIGYPVNSEDGWSDKALRAEIYMTEAPDKKIYVEGSWAGFGNNREEIEADALAQARMFFGDIPVLRIMKDYSLTRSSFQETRDGKAPYKAFILFTNEPEDAEPELDDENTNQAEFIFEETKS